jgi:putative transposase
VTAFKNKRSKRKKNLPSPDEPQPVQLVEQHLVRQGDFYFDRIDQAAFAAKNLYNKTNYLVRQAYILEHCYIGYGGTYHLVKDSAEYRALPRKVSNQILLQVDHDWQAFFGAMKAWREDPSKFLGRPRLPGYKHKSQGRNLLVYEAGAIGKKALREGLVKPSQLGILIPTQQKHVNQVRVVPRKGYYVIEVVYTVLPQPAEGLRADWYAGIDVGVNNLAALTSNKVGFRPYLVNGRPLKAINQAYHKARSYFQSLLPAGRHLSQRIIDLTNKRNRQIKHYLHVASKRIIDLLVAEGIGTLVIGKNKNWKQKVQMGKQNNQSFVSIPFAQFIAMLTYKAHLMGIQVIGQEEAYTSKCSFLDLEPIRKQKTYQGKRVERGLFRAGDGRLINADVNGSYNILRKAIPDAFKNGLTGIILHPVRLFLEYPHKACHGYRKGSKKKPQTPAMGNGVGAPQFVPSVVALGRCEQLVA